MWILITYLLILSAVSLLSYRKGFQNVFRTEKKLPWYLAGFSIFMFNPDTILVLSKMGIVATEGYSGMWIFYSGVLGAGFLPILFAPLWSRLRFMTDNQFILFRFSGRSARVLHLFRAVYVGYLVVALFIAQAFVALSKILVIFFEMSYGESFLCIGGLLAIMVAKNSLQVKVRSDFLNGILYIGAFAVGAFFVVRHFGGFGDIYPKLNKDYTSVISLFPDRMSDKSFGSLPTLLVYFLVQWWSIQILDGGGPEAQRFMNSKGPYQAFKAAFLPLILFSVVFVFHSLVMDAGIILVNESAHQIPQTLGSVDLEAVFLNIYRIAMPGSLSLIIFLAFLVALLSYLEAYINWGSSFVVVDLFKTYVFKSKQDRFYTRLSYLVMALIGVTGIVIAWYNTHLLGLQKFIFSMAAGVGPVFILRWFWWRVNAWSQLSAMIASLVLAVSWDLLYDHSQGFQLLIDSGMAFLNMSLYALKLVVLTLLVSLIWLLVTFLTPPDDPETLKRYMDQVKPGGWWPQQDENSGENSGESSGGKSRRVSGRKLSGRFSFRKLILLILYPIISLLPFLIIWLFKFGSVPLAIVLIFCWIGLVYGTISSLGQILKQR